MHDHTGETTHLTALGRVKCAAWISVPLGLLTVLLGVVVYAYPHIVAPAVPGPVPVTVRPVPLPPQPAPISETHSPQISV